MRAHSDSNLKSFTEHEVRKTKNKGVLKQGNAVKNNCWWWNVTEIKIVLWKKEKERKKSLVTLISTYQIPLQCVSTINTMKNHQLNIKTVIDTLTQTVFAVKSANLEKMGADVLHCSNVTCFRGILSPLPLKQSVSLLLTVVITTCQRLGRKWIPPPHS